MDFIFNFFDSLFSMGFWGIVVILAFLFIWASYRIVRQQTEQIVERFGKYHRTLRPGLNFIIPVVDRTVAIMPLRVLQLDVVVETKTKDNVFITIPVAVQYQITDSQKAYYTLDNYETQIHAYVFDSVRNITANLKLDEAFEAKEEIATSLESTLKESLESYGFSIKNTLVTDINPDEKVRSAMNDINAAQRTREAAIALAEADKIRLVKQAEAEAESKRLQGEGVANQRSAIVEGLVHQYQMMRDAGCTENVQEILLMTQYFDTLSEVSRNSQTKTIMVPSNPGGANNLLQEIRNALLLEVTKTTENMSEEEKSVHAAKGAASKSHGSYSQPYFK